MKDSQVQNQIQRSGHSKKTGLKQLWANLRGLPRNAWEATVRRGPLDSPRAKSQAVFCNIFLHLHSVRVHRWTLKKTFTLGLGIASAALFVILAVTGILLMVYYKPTVAGAYDSIKDIHYVVPGGRLLRNVHRWAGHMMVVTVFLHMVRVFLTRSYLKPREFNWLIGVGLLAATLVLSYTGYCLTWDQLAYWALVIGSNIAGSFRELTDALNITGYLDLGGLMRKLFLGANEVGDETILRFYWLHCILLPILTSILIAVHFWRIRKDGGMSRPKDFRPEELDGTPKDDLADSAFQNEQKTYTLMCVVPGKSHQVEKGPEDTVLSWPHLLRAEMAVFMVILAVVLVLGVFFDAPLKEVANPNVPENPAKAPWYFLGLQELVSYSAFTGGMLIPVLAIFSLASIPFLDRQEGISGRWPPKQEATWIWASCLFSLLTCVGLLAIVVNFGWLRNWIPNINQLWIILFNPGTILITLFFFYSIFVVWLTGSTRLGAIATFCCFMVSFIVLTYFGTVHRGPGWEFFWWPSQWVTH